MRANTRAVTWQALGQHYGYHFFYSNSVEYQWTNIYRERNLEGAQTTGDLTAAEIRTGSSGEPWRGYNPTDYGRHWAVPRDNHFAQWLSVNLIPGYTDIQHPHDRLDALDDAGLIEWSSRGRPSLIRPAESSPGAKVNNLWYDIPRTPNSERLGYPTQKPEALLERIIRASSNEGDVVLDPFCGCGTAVAAAHKLGRQWLGIDITHLAVALMKNRLKTGFDLEAGRDYEVIGEPQDEGSARALWEQDPYQFQFWAVSLLEAQPQSEQRRGADRGIDGMLYFIDGPRRTPQKAVIQVKGGRVSSPQVRDLKGVVEREQAAMGLFISLEPPTRDMRQEAASSDFYHSDLWARDFPKIQLRTVGEMLSGNGFELPPRPADYQPAQRVRRPQGHQARLGEEG